MHNPMTDLSPAAWENRYQTGEIPWDLAGPTPELLRLLEEKILPTKGRVLIPGGGRGHDAVHLAKAGWDTHLVDFAPTALNAVLEEAARAKVTVSVYHHDFFTLPTFGSLQERFSAIWEYTFFCAIDPALRPAYAKAAAALLPPGGLFVGLFFPTESAKEPPPFPVSREEVRAIFAPYFEMEIGEPRASVKPRAGREFLGMFRRR
jgi:SAM-dependent methyltransferase